MEEKRIYIYNNNNILLILHNTRGMTRREVDSSCCVSRQNNAIFWTESHQE